MHGPFDDRPANMKAKVAAIYAFLVMANFAVWAWAWIAFADRPALLGTAFLAYTFGLRHAFNADHIAAIDNVVRKLMQQGKSPYSVGFFFSLGHSTIVVLASVAIAFTAAALKGRLDEFHDLGGVIGTLVSALFLLIIGIVNLLILRRIWAAFSRARRGDKIIDDDLDALLSGRGLIARIFRPIMSFWTVLSFPALFTAGMSLMDTTDSVLMTRAYGWAFVHPIRKVWYNLTITAASVVVAIFIGGIEALGLIGDELGLSRGFWDLVGNLNNNLTNFGFAIVGIFIASWLIATVIYKTKRYDSLQTSRT